MGKKSDRRIFRKRRQRAGFALLVSLAVVVVGAIMFSSLKPFGNLSNLSAQGSAQGGGAEAVQRVDAPAVDRAPEAVAEAEKAQKEPEQASGPPPIPQPASNDLWMDIPALGLNDNYIANSEDPAAMDAGAIKLPSTGFPWQNDANTYIAAHRIGYPGTESDYQFYDLPNLALGDKIYLYDSNMTVYTYEVTGFKEVLPTENYVTAPQPGRDMISLQTCIEDYGDYWTMGPNWYVRYVVEADRVSVDPA